MAGKYQAYPEYKDSEVEWLGKIPKSWTIKKLKYLCQVQTGNKDTVNAVENGDFPFFVRSQTVERINSIGADCEAVLTAGDGAGVGKVFHYYKGPFDFHQRVYMLNNFTNTTGRFAYYFLSNNFHKVALDGNAKSTVDSLRMPQFLNFEFSLPDVATQNKIVSFLDHQTAKIDNLIEKQQELVTLLKEKRQAVISHAVTKGLNPNAPMKPSGVEWLGDVPSAWQILKLKHIISALESGVSVNAADIPSQPNELGVLKTSCVYTRKFRIDENKTVFEDEQSRVRCPIRKGALIISRMNTPELVGASALVDHEDSTIFLPDRLWQTVFSDKYKVNPEFIAHFMTTIGFRNQISLGAEGASSSMQCISKEKYLEITCLIPPKKTQDDIVKFLNHKIESLDSLEAQSNTAITLLQERRTALISAAVTGKIDVRNWQAPQSPSEDTP